MTLGVRAQNFDRKTTFSKPELKQYKESEIFTKMTICHFLDLPMFAEVLRACPDLFAESTFD